MLFFSPNILPGILEVVEWSEQLRPVTYVWPGSVRRSIQVRLCTRGCKSEKYVWCNNNNKNNINNNMSFYPGCMFGLKKSTVARKRFSIFVATVVCVSWKRRRELEAHVVLSVMDKITNLRQVRKLFLQ